MIYMFPFEALPEMYFRQTPNKTCLIQRNGNVFLYKSGIFWRILTTISNRILELFLKDHRLFF